MDAIKPYSKKCIFCGEEIQPNTARCPHCGSLLDVRAERFQPEAVNPDQQPEEPNTQEQITEQPDLNDKETETSEQPYQQEENVQTPVATTIDGQRKSIQKPVNSALSNGLKVFLTIICTFVPFIGQLAGIIIAIVFMNSEEDQDRRSFGLALLIASIIFFLFACMGCLVIGLAASASKGFR